MSRPFKPASGRVLAVLLAAALVACPGLTAAQSVNVTYEGSVYGAVRSPRDWPLRGGGRRRPDLFPAHFAPTWHKQRAPRCGRAPVGSPRSDPPPYTQMCLR